MVNWAQTGFQDTNSFMSTEFIFFYDFIMLILTVIIYVVLMLIIFSLLNSFIAKGLVENQLLETLWTLLPGVVLIYIALPSLSLLYLFEESYSSDISLKAVGHQWYWEYEFYDFGSKEVVTSWDSYLLPYGGNSQFRLLDVDVRLVLPFFTNIRMLVSSADVLHAWAVPSLGLKADATPGRLNQLSFMGVRSGLFYGQCSEICGANHSFMPIVIEMINLEDFMKWCYFNLMD